MIVFAADRVVHAPDIIVNRARQTNDREAELLREQLCAAQRSVTADHAESLDAAFDQILMAAAAPLRRRPLLAACRSEERTAPLDDITDVLGLELPHILIQEPLIAVVDTPHMDAFIECCACNGTCRCIHSGTVSSACHNCNAF